MDDYQHVEILLVEDNPHDAELTMRSLKKGQLLNKVLWVKDGQEALDYLNRAGAYSNRGEDDHPRLILLDLKMPKVDGVEVLKRIKSDERLKSIPVVVMTSSSEPPDVLKCYQFGVNSYVVKPVDLGEFMEAVAKIGMYWIMTNRGIQG